MGKKRYSYKEIKKRLDNMPDYLFMWNGVVCRHDVWINSAMKSLGDELKLHPPEGEPGEGSYLLKEVGINFIKQ